MLLPIVKTEPARFAPWRINNPLWLFGRCGSVAAQGGDFGRPRHFIQAALAIGGSGSPASPKSDTGYDYAGYLLLDGLRRRLDFSAPQRAVMVESADALDAVIAAFGAMAAVRRGAPAEFPRDGLIAVMDDEVSPV